MQLLENHHTIDIVEIRPIKYFYDFRTFVGKVINIGCRRCPIGGVVSFVRVWSHTLMEVMYLRLQLIQLFSGNVVVALPTTIIILVYIQRTTFMFFYKCNGIIWFQTLNLHGTFIVYHNDVITIIVMLQYGCLHSTIIYRTSVGYRFHID